MQTSGNKNIIGDEISLYFHIPFCSKKCDYCHFYVLPDKQEYHSLLIEGILLDIERCAPLIVGKKIVSLYFGGGTPSLLSAEEINTILNKVREYCPFDASQIEITLEANPESVSADQIKAYAAIGINRISMGFQALDDALLKKLGRTHHKETALQAVDIVKNNGISNISIDLMYDIPLQTLATWKSTLKQAAQLPITHLSLYNLTIEPNTVFFKYRHSLQQELPDADESAHMYKEALHLFKEAGLLQYEISAFERHGLYSRHNVGYWTGRPFLGFGPSAFSYWEGRRYRAAANLNKYVRQLRAGESPEDFSEQLDPKRRRKELLAIALRMVRGVDLIKFQANYGNLEPCTMASLIDLYEKGLLEEKDSTVKLTPQGILFYDAVAVELV